MKFKNHFKIGLIVITLIVVVGIVSQYYANKKNLWEKVEYIKVKETFTVSGHIEALNKSNLAAPLTGKIIAVFVDEGDVVNKGDLLAQYETDTYIAQSNELQASLFQSTQNYQKLLSGNRKQDIDKAKANYHNNQLLLETKKLQYEKYQKDELRKKSLYETRMIPAKEYEDLLKDLEISKADYNAQKFTLESALNDYKLAQEGFRKEDIQAAKGTVNTIEAQISNLKTILDKTDVKSPINGKIINKFVHAGENVVTGSDLFNIVDKSSLYVKALIEEEDISNIIIDDKVKMELDAYPGKILIGQITSIYEQVEETTKLLPVRIDIKENQYNLKLLPGMTANCTFSGHLTDYLAVPEKAIQREGKKFYVSTAYGKVYLEVGKSQNGMVLIKGKLKAGDAVLIK